MAEQGLELFPVQALVRQQASEGYASVLALLSNM